MPAEKVLVTGASGFIAKHCIAELLRKGFAVRGTLRDLGRADWVRQGIARAGANPAGVEVPQAKVLNIVPAPSHGTIYPLSV